MKELLFKRPSMMALVFILGFALLFFEASAQNNNGLRLTGPYLGQKPPGKIPEIFAPGIITTEYHEHSSPVFSTNGNEVYWSVFYNFWGPQVIVFMRQDENQIWEEAKVAPFSGQYSDGSPFIAPNGNTLLFESNRPISNTDEFTGDINIWMVEKEGKDWGEPKNLGPGINSDQWERGPFISNSGNLYFCSMHDGGYGGMDLYRSMFIDGSYSEAENLGSTINTSGYESWPFVAPDENYIIYESSSGQLHVSFRDNDNSWSESKNLSESLGFHESQDRMARLTNDGKYLFFVSNRRNGKAHFGSQLELNQIKERATNINNGMGNVYWVDAAVIEDLRPKN